MRNRTLLHAAVVCLACACTTSDEGAALDASASADAADMADMADMADAPDVAFDPRCGDLRSDYMDAVNDAKTCSSDEDCKLIEGSGTCDCALSWGNASGDVVNGDFAYPEDWSRRLDACADVIADFSNECDAEPGENVRCVEGVCAADSPSCLD